MKKALYTVAGVVAWIEAILNLVEAWNDSHAAVGLAVVVVVVLIVIAAIVVSRENKASR